MDKKITGIGVMKTLISLYRKIQYRLKPVIQFSRMKYLRNTTKAMHLQESKLGTLGITQKPPYQLKT